MPPQNPEVHPITLEELEKVVSTQVDLSLTRLELRLSEKFALRTEVQATQGSISALAQSLQTLKEAAVLKTGPVFDQLREDHTRLDRLHDEALTRVPYEKIVDGNQSRIDGLETWRNRMAGTLAILTPVTIGLVGFLIQRLFG